MKMKINTEYFGEIEYEEQELLTFPEGLFGFEKDRRFLPVPFGRDSDTLLCLQSVDREELSFILVNPFSFFPQYHPVLSRQDYQKLGTDKEENLSYYVLCIVGEGLENSRVNLRCPIVVNVLTRVAVQVILEDTSYSFRQPLMQNGADKEGLC